MCFDKILAGGRTPFKSKGFVTQFTKPFVAVTASHGLQICIKCDESYLFLIEWTVPRIMNNADII